MTSSSRASASTVTPRKASGRSSTLSAPLRSRPAKTGNPAWGALFGVRHIAHDWTFITEAFTAELDESWTDGIVGITHAVPFGEKWAWANRLDAGFGGSEGSYLFSSGFNWRFTMHWSLNFGAKMSAIEFGDEAEIDNADFYLYDVDEPSFGLGVMYNW